MALLYGGRTTIFLNLHFILFHQVFLYVESVKIRERTGPNEISQLSHQKQAFIPLFSAAGISLITVYNYRVSALGCFRLFWDDIVIFNKIENVGLTVFCRCAIPAETPVILSSLPDLWNSLENRIGAARSKHCNHFNMCYTLTLGNTE